MDWRGRLAILGLVVGLTAGVWYLLKPPPPSLYGGPYAIATATPPAASNQPTLDKQAEFDEIKKTKTSWKSSIATLLQQSPTSPQHLLGPSIDSNKTSMTNKYADQYQRSNYVVKEGKIRVATWAFESRDADFNVVCGPGGAAQYPGARVQSGMMIDFFAEEQSLPPGSTAPKEIPGWEPPKSPPAEACTSVSKQGFLQEDKSVGVMDAHSKHFMLVQRVGAKLTDYPIPQAQSLPWENAVVEYAGEIIVNVKLCEYLIN